MNTQPKTKILVLLIALLAISNLVLVGIFLSRKPQGRMQQRDEQMRSFLKKDLGFSNAQMATYEIGRSAHKDSIKKLFEGMRNNKQQNLLALSAAGFTDSAINAIAAKACEHQKTLEQKMLMHLRDVRNICTPDQRLKFDSGIAKLFTRKDKNKK